MKRCYPKSIVVALSRNWQNAFLTQLDLDTLATFRATWTQGPRTSLKKLEGLRAFMRFAEKRKWIADNPAIDLKAPKVPNKPTMPFTREEPRSNKRYFFWTGASTVRSGKGKWQRRFEFAKVPTGHPHRLRDTFAVELLLAGVPLDRVSILLGHSSIRVTERHYAPWTRSRQEQIEADLRAAWSNDPLIKEVHGAARHQNSRVFKEKDW